MLFNDVQDASHTKASLEKISTSGHPSRAFRQYNTVVFIFQLKIFIHCMQLNIPPVVDMASFKTRTTSMDKFFIW
jgi:hypothetical protein